MDTYMYKCPNCGSGMEYDADTHIFHCEYCLSDFTADELEEKRKRQKQRRRNLIEKKLLADLRNILRYTAAQTAELK